MNWFFTRRHIAINLDLVTKVFFTVTDEKAHAARLCINEPHTPDESSIVFLNEDADKLYRELKAYSPE
jgi:hypothetical protein